MKRELVEMMKNDRLLKSAVQEVNKMDMIKASLVVRNSRHQKLDIDKILEGELAKDVPVKDYVFIENFCDLVRVGFNCLEMGNYLDRNLLISGYRILSDDEKGFFRKNNPVIYAFNHVPVYSADIEERLDDALRRVYSLEAGNNVILKAMYIHNKIIDIWPFQEYSAELAIYAMNYYLMEQGITPINMPITKEEYLLLVSDCLKGQRQEEFYNFLCHAVYDKMEGTVEACKEYLKNNK
jgi:hypothetical protein